MKIRVVLDPRLPADLVILLTTVPLLAIAEHDGANTKAAAQGEQYGEVSEECENLFEVLILPERNNLPRHSTRKICLCCFEVMKRWRGLVCAFVKTSHGLHHQCVMETNVRLLMDTVLAA